MEQDDDWMINGIMIFNRAEFTRFVEILSLLREKRSSIRNVGIVTEKGYPIKFVYRNKKHGVEKYIVFQCEHSDTIDIERDIMSGVDVLKEYKKIPFTTIKLINAYSQCGCASYTSVYFDNVFYKLTAF